ncbi:hypothetical protein BJX99DRAFT_258050 [Aspergillus californicus]
MHLVPIQVYSTVPLDQDHDKLRDYLLNGFTDWEVLPLFEIYSYCPPDAFACVEHQRREIAYRKQQHLAGAPNPPPLIPQFSHHDKSPRGCCILLRSHSYRLGDGMGDPDLYAEAGDSPDWLYFNRAFHDLGHNDQGDSPFIESASNSKLPLEGFELSVEPVRDQRQIGQTIICNIFHSGLVAKDNTSFEYALGQDEGVPLIATQPSEDIRRQLDCQVLAGGFVVDESFPRSHEAGGVSVTNAPDSESDLQYLIFMPFLSHILGAEFSFA